MNGYVFLAVPILAGVAAGYIMASSQEMPEVAGLTAAALLGDAPLIGDPDSAVTILEWGDYQCTFCFRFHQSSLGILKEQYVDTGRASIAFRDFPLNGPDSVLAAGASHCAKDQKRYWEYHDELYSNWGGERTGWITPDALAEFARTAGLDADEFGECMDGQTHILEVIRTRDFGSSIGVDATPFFFVFNDEEVIRIVGNQPVEVFRRAIEELEGGASASDQT